LIVENFSLVWGAYFNKAIGDFYAKNKNNKRHILRGEKVFVRMDFNVPLNEYNSVSDDARVVAALSTIEYLVQSGAKVILASHLRRPDGERMAKYSMSNVTKILAKHLRQAVLFWPN
jgi:3-phosphoglycerate kinase